MKDRERIIMRAALLYMQTNLDDVNDAFANSTEEDLDNESGTISVNREVTSPFEEDEVAHILTMLR